MYTILREQVVAADAETVWNFLKNPRNLNEITPSELQFQILSDLPEEMYTGLLIEYFVKIPLFGRWRWVTEIKHVIPGVSFVDEQRIGPYKFWYHSHRVEPLASGTKIIDHVHYQMPFGILGRLVHLLHVRQTLERVFKFRSEQLTAILG